MIYVDANIFIYPVLYRGNKSEAAKHFLKEVVNGQKAITSCLSIDEIVWNIWQETENRQKGITQGKRLFYFPNLKVVRLRPIEIHSALDLMTQYKKLTPRDAIHAATALERNITRLLSDDKDFEQVNELQWISLDDLTKNDL